MWLLIYLIFCKRDTRLCCNIDCKKKKFFLFIIFSIQISLFIEKENTTLRRTSNNAYRLNRLNRDIFQDMFFCQTILNRKKRRISVLKYFCRFSHFSFHSLFFSLLIHQKRIGELNHKKKKFQKRNRYFGFLYRSLVLILLSWSNFKTVIQFLKESIIEMVRYGNKGNYRRYN